MYVCPGCTYVCVVCKYTCVVCTSVCTVCTYVCVVGRVGVVYTICVLCGVAWRGISVYDLYGVVGVYVDVYGV